MYISVRCPKCGRKLMELDGMAMTKCPRCKNMIDIDAKRDEMARVR